MSDTTTTDITTEAAADTAVELPTPAHVGSVTDADTAEAAEEVTSKPRSRFTDVEVGDDGMPTPEVLREGLKAVIDPEIGYNIVDLGLVYGVTKPEPGHVHVEMTLTAMGCPLVEVIQQQVTMVMLAFPGVESADVEFTFSPPWSPEMIADYVRDELRAMGMNV
jgi:metal-sulfur cluster biosynthetic enzyme